MSEPKQLVVLSGKGGTGKTTITAALADLASRECTLSLADADVDAANLELVLGAEKVSTEAFVGGFLADIDPLACTACGACFDACRFGAVIFDDGAGAYRVDATACEGCAACTYRCPVDAITMVDPPNGNWFESETRYGPLFHAHLFAGGENSGKLVTVVKQQARLRALDEGRDLVLVDGPPGIGCPVIAAASGADLVLMVVEPTMSGVHDLDRVLDLVDHFGLAAQVLVNKADLSQARTEDLVVACQARGIPLVAQLPYDTIATEAMVAGMPVTSYAESSISAALVDVWCQLRAALSLNSPH